ncbi:MAG: hypothetical protein HC811_03245 [Flammeovirgaceae bacterium]|nr:hypothetical protein [Flammeovirgaceae bacterium]
MGLRYADLFSDTIPVDTSHSKVVRVNRVIIIGNKITRDHIIARELSVKPGDTINLQKLSIQLIRDRERVYNLRLFNTVSLRTLELSPDTVDLLVEVTERWYTFPVPIFELSDRNFNEWWQTYNHDFSRINYGIRLYQYNFRGRNETLRLTAQFGFTRNFELIYRIPNLDRQQKHGLTFAFDFSEPKNLAYFTENHKLSFLRLRETLRETLGGGISYSFRRSFYETHTFSATYRDSHVSDTIVSLNPNYYKYNSTSQRFGTVSYQFVSDHRDVMAYPLKGFRFSAFISQVGLGLSDDANQLELNVTHAQHFDLGKNYYLSNFSSIYLSSPSDQPYSLFGALGYQKQFIRGYELNVIEGPWYVLNKTTFKKKIFSRNWNLDGVTIEQFQYFPLTIYLKTYADFGYVENYPLYEENQFNQELSNRFLLGGGLGIDMVTVYDTVLRFEYSITREGARGFFFHAKKEF